MLRFARVSAAVFQAFTLRRIAAPALLLVIITLAWMLQRDMLESGLLAPLDWLGGYELFHIAAHLAIFGGIALLLGPRKRGGSRALVWVYVLAGGALIEVIQFFAGGEALTLRILAGSLFDLGVDMLGALAGLGIMARRQRSRSRRPNGRFPFNRDSGDE